MKTKICDDILNYISFLQDKGLQASLSFKEDLILMCDSRLLNTTIHAHPLCYFLKNQPLTKDICIHKKHTKFLNNDYEFFYGCCWAGIEEYVFPIKDGNKIIAYVHISGYRGNIKYSKNKLESAIKKYKLDRETVLKLYDSNLKIEPPQKDKVLWFIKPFEYMILNLWGKLKCLNNEITFSGSLYFKITSYLHQNFANFSLKQMSADLKYSPSYLRLLFKEQSGENITQYLTKIRIEKSKELLKYSSLNITEIAFLVGFKDSNYFSSVFKKVEKISPLRFRQKITERPV